MEWKDWIGKKIFVKLSSGDCYNGVCKDVDVDNTFLLMIDKYGDNVAVAISQIIKIVEGNNGH